MRGRAQEAQNCGESKISFFDFFDFFELFESLRALKTKKASSFGFCFGTRTARREGTWYVYVSFLLYIDYIMLMFFSVYSFSHSLLYPKQARRAASVCILLRVFSRRVRGSFFLSLSLYYVYFDSF